MILTREQIARMIDINLGNNNRLNDGIRGISIFVGVLHPGNPSYRVSFSIARRLEPKGIVCNVTGPVPPALQELTPVEEMLWSVWLWWACDQLASASLGARLMINLHIPHGLSSPYVLFLLTRSLSPCTK